MTAQNSTFLLPLEAIDPDYVDQFGQVATNLSNLSRAGLPVSKAFVVLPQAYHQSLEPYQKKISGLINSLDILKPQQINSTSRQIVDLIQTIPLDPILSSTISKAYQKLNSSHVCLRTSLVSDTTKHPELGFINLPVYTKGDANLLNLLRESWAQLFAPNPLISRLRHGLDYSQLSPVVLVQASSNSQVSGIAYTHHPINANQQTLVVEAVWGLPTPLLEGSLTPDHYQLSSKTQRLILSQTSNQTKQWQFNSRSPSPQVVSVKSNLTDVAKLNSTEFSKLLALITKIKHQLFFPQEIEWQFDSGRFIINSSKTLVTSTPTKTPVLSAPSLSLLTHGSPASAGIASGPVKFIHTQKDAVQIKPGQIILTSFFTPELLPLIKNASGIITETGGLVSHAAIISRELAVPCVVAAKDAFNLIHPGQIVTLNGATGEIFSGQIPSSHPITYAPPQNPDLITATKVTLNLSDDSFTEVSPQLPSDGVGLIDAHSIILNLPSHPKYLKTKGKTNYFLEPLTHRLIDTVGSFAHRPVRYRLSQLTSHQLLKLPHAKTYEPIEANPLLGFRGLYRHLNDDSLFSVELKAIQQVRHQFPQYPFQLLVPLVRHPHHLKLLKQKLSSFGLRRTSNFSLWVNVDLPTVAHDLPTLLNLGIDGIVLDLDALNVFSLGIDPSNHELASLASFVSPAVLSNALIALKTASKSHLPCAVISQKSSSLLEILPQLLEHGLTEVITNPKHLSITRSNLSTAELHHISN